MQKTKSKSRTKSDRSGLAFPVGRINSILKKEKRTKRMSELCAPALAAGGEYLLAEILELAANVARENKTTRISPRHIELAIRGDDELNRIFRHTTISEGGTMPLLHDILVTKPSRKSTKARKTKEPAKGKGKGKSKATPKGRATNIMV
jgi:histone H2A